MALEASAEVAGLGGRAREDLVHESSPFGDGDQLFGRQGGGALGEPPHHIEELVELVTRLHVDDRDTQEEDGLLLAHDHDLVRFERDLDRRLIADCHCLEPHVMSPYLTSTD